MERQYIWFRTGAGCGVAALGCLLATIAALALMLTAREVTGVHFALVFALYAIGLLPAFLMEQPRYEGRASDVLRTIDQGISRRFTDRARTIMRLADEEANRLNHEYIGTEHILAGLVEEGAGVAVNVLVNLGIGVRQIRAEAAKIIKSGPELGRITFRELTPRARRVIELAYDESRNFNHNYIGTEHILLGLLREEEGVAAQVLRNLGLAPADVRREILKLLESESDRDADG